MLAEVLPLAVGIGVSGAPGYRSCIIFPQTLNPLSNLKFLSRLDKSKSRKVA